MEYVFGTDDRRGRRTLLTKGSEHTALAGFCEVVREYADCTITDSFYAVRKTGSDEDSEGSCYDWYDIDLHYRVIDKTKPVKADTLALGQAQTDLQLDQIEQGQFATELQLQMMEAMQNV